MSEAGSGHVRLTSGGSSRKSADDDVITHMAQKYSQWNLPSLEAIEAGIDDDPAAVSAAGAAGAPAAAVVTSDDGGSVKSGSIGRMRPLSTRGAGPKISAMDEMAILQETRNLAEKVFDKTIDTSGEGDVDLEEFTKGMAVLQVELSAAEIAQMFEHIVELGDCEDGYIDKQAFGDFMCRTFASPKLQMFQSKVLSRLSEHRMDDGVRTLLHAEEAGDWGAAEIDLVEMEMKSAMETMVDSEMKKVKESQEWEQELERLSAEDGFADPSRAPDWNAYEVAYFLQSHGHTDAAMRFFKEGIDGSMLLHDISQPTLIELGVRVLHAPKLMRNILQIRKKTEQPTNSYAGFTLEMVSDLCVFRIESDESLVRMSVEMEEEFQQTTQALEDEKKQSMVLSNELEKLKAELAETKQQLSESQSECEELRRANQEIVQEKALEIGQLSEKHASKVLAMMEERDAASKESAKRREEEMNLLSNTLKESIEARLRIEIEKEFKELSKNQLEAERRALIAATPPPPGADRAAPSAVLASLDAAPMDHGKYEHLSITQPMDSNGGSSTLQSMIEEVKLKKEEDPEFASPERCFEWDSNEVAYWLSTIHCQKYLPAFIEFAVDGAMLLNDLDESTMSEELGIKRIHCSKMTREIKKLKSVAPPMTSEGPPGLAAAVELTESGFILLAHLAPDASAIIAAAAASGGGGSGSSSSKVTSKKSSHMKSASAGSDAGSSTSSSQAAKIPLAEETEASVIIDVLAALQKYVKLMASQRTSDEWHDKFSKVKLETGERIWKPTPGLTAQEPLPPMPATDSLTPEWKQFVFAIVTRYHDLNVICDKQRYVIKKSMSNLQILSKKHDELTHLVKRQKDEHSALDRKYIRLKYKYRKITDPARGGSGLSGISAGGGGASSPPTYYATGTVGGPTGMMRSQQSVPTDQVSRSSFISSSTAASMPLEKLSTGSGASPMYGSYSSMHSSGYPSTTTSTGFAGSVVSPTGARGMSFASSASGGAPPMMGSAVMGVAHPHAHAAHVHASHAHHHPHVAHHGGYTVGTHQSPPGGGRPMRYPAPAHSVRSGTSERSKESEASMVDKLISYS